MNVRAGLKFLMSAVLILPLACSDNEETQNEHINRWIQRQMNTYYLWSDEMPSPRKALPPDVYFDQLLVSDKDRFSWIQEDYLELVKSLQGINKEAGCEYIFYNPVNTNEVFGHIKYIKPNSPAEEAGLLRGDVVTHINGQELTTTNAGKLIGQLGRRYTIEYQRYNFETEEWESKGELTLTPIEYTENPNYLHTVFNMGGHKIGYYVYNFFAPGTENAPNQYNTEMDQIFGEFKAAGITDLIIDLRYNSGGAETATIKLASLLAPNVTPADVFAYRRYNEFIMDELQAYPEFFQSNFTTEPNNLGANLSGKVYVLTSEERTASASELLINGLRPYMDVIIVGGKTIGKNVGSITLYETNAMSIVNKWGLQPIVVQSYNKNMQSDYSEGFDPQFPVSENTAQLFLLPLGDEDEPLLAAAIGQITGEGSKKKPTEELEVTEISSSALKAKNFNLLIDNEFVVKKLKEKMSTTQVQ